MKSKINFGAKETTVSMTLKSKCRSIAKEEFIKTFKLVSK